MLRRVNLLGSGVAPLDGVNVAVLVRDFARLVNEVSIGRDDLVNLGIEVVRVEGVTAVVIDEEIPSDENTEPRKDDWGLPDAPNLLSVLVSRFPVFLSFIHGTREQRLTSN